MDESLHGGRVHAARRELGWGPAELLDFSANLNPLGPPAGVMALLQKATPDLITAYPDSEAPRLRALLCSRHGATESTLVLGSGGASLLFLALRALSPRRVLVPEPCFREQPRAVAACGAELVPVPMVGLRLDLERLEPPVGDALLLTNPHNPTGQRLSPGELGPWILRHPGLAVIVDEAFMDYAPQESLLPQILERPRTVILRSLTKFFAMPGLRVGYAFADAVTAARMTDLQESWPVGQLELLAAEAALLDREYEDRTLTAFREDLPRFQDELQALGLFPLPSRAPFVLTPVPGSATALARALEAEGILVRTCARWPGLGDSYLRLALGHEAARTRLRSALSKALAGHR